MSTLFFFLKKVMSEKAETKTRKKNGAHTNSRTTVQLDERNIHVGCCLFSHTPKLNKIQKTSVSIQQR